MRIYLAGKMGGRLGYEVIAERAAARKICNRYGIDFIDPGETEVEHIRPDDVISLKLDYTAMKSFVAKDEYAIRNCDALLVLTGDLSSEGTSWEMGFAHFELKIPVIMVAPKRLSGELMGFSNIKVDAIFGTVEEAVRFLAENYAICK